MIGDAGSASPVGSAIKRGVRYIDDLGRMVLNKGDDVARFAVKHADDLAKISYKYGDDVADLVRKYGDEVFEISDKNRARLLKLSGNYPDSVVRVALHGGDDAIKALARKRFLTKPLAWVKEHPFITVLTGSLFWFRDAITS